MSQTNNCVIFNPNAMTWWPNKLPEEVLDYTLDITSTIDPTQDFAVSANVSIAPSGTGEMTPSNLFITTKTLCGVPHTYLTVTLSGGQQGRTYIIKFDVTMTDNRVFGFLVYQNIIEILPGGQASVPQSPDFGTPVVDTGGGGNPVISFSGTITSPFDWLVYPALGIYTDGQLNYGPGPAVDYIGAPTQNEISVLTVSNASSYIDIQNGFTLSSTLLTTLSFPNLVTWVGAFTANLPALTALNLPTLTVLNGIFSPTITDMVTLNLPTIVTVGGNFIPTATALEAFTMNSGLLTFNGDFKIIGAALQQSSVDGILEGLAKLDGTLGTTLYTGHTVDLSGGSNATPSVAGLAAKAILIGNSNVVNTN